ncbi:hypothetical protein E4T39_03025 [Aureobasidium subglaciale]|nr:hypothetical protein E4T39_03025 [Aureobasidium subglaciale]
MSHPPPQQAAFEQDFPLFATPVTQKPAQHRAQSLAPAQQPTTKQLNLSRCHASPLLPVSTESLLTNYKFVATAPPVLNYLDNSSASNVKIAAKFNQPIPNSTNSDSMSFGFSFNEPKVNVAYSDTSADLSFGSAAFLKDGADMPLYQQYPESQFNGNDFNESDFYAAMTNFNAAHPQTISPQQLDLNAAFPLPPSATISDLSFNDSDVLFSPELSDNMDTPLFGNKSADPSPYVTDNMVPGGPQNWPSLFPSNEPSLCPGDEAVVPSEASTIPTGADLRKRSLGSSSVLASPSMSSAARPAGVRKNKSKPLAPIVVDEDDPTALKRARNTLAARKSRGKKTEYVDNLEARVKELEALLLASQQENAQLKAQVNPPQINDALDHFMNSL